MIKNTKETIAKTFFKYVSLNIMSMVGLSLYVLADTFFVANGIGTDGLVALNLVIPAYGFINAIGLLLGIGGGTLFSVAVGRGDGTKGNKYFTAVVVIGLVIGVGLTILGLTASSQIAQLLGAKDQLIPLARDYIRVLLLFSCPFILNNILVAFVRNDHAPKLAMSAMLFGCLSNIVLDYIMIFPLNWGMTGAAIATGMAPIVGLLISSSHFLRHKNHFKMQKGWLPTAEIIRVLLAGVPSFIGEISASMIIFLFNLVLLRLTGSVGVAAYGIIANIGLVCMSIFNGVAQGIQPIISRAYGAKRFEDIKKILRMANITVLILGIAFYTVGNLFPQQICSAFVDTSNTELMGYAVQGIRLYFLAFLLMGFNIVFISHAASTVQPKISFTLSIMRGFAVVIPLVFLLSSLLHVDGVWLAVPITEAITLATALGFTWWKKKRL